MSTSPITGILIRVGTFTAGDETVSGYLIAASEDQIRAVRGIPMYRTVEIVPVEPQPKKDLP